MSKGLSCELRNSLWKACLLILLPERGHRKRWRPSTLRCGNKDMGCTTKSYRTGNILGRPTKSLRRRGNQDLWGQNEATKRRSASSWANLSKIQRRRDKGKTRKVEDPTRKTTERLFSTPEHPGTESSTSGAGNWKLTRTKLTPKGKKTYDKSAEKRHDSEPTL